MLDRYELLEGYREHLLAERYRSARTWHDDRRILVAFWDHAGKPPSRATPADLQRFLDRRTAPGGTSRGTGLADTTRHTYASVVRSFYRWAYAAEIATLRIEDCHLGARPHVRVRGKGRKERALCPCTRGWPRCCRPRWRAGRAWARWWSPTVTRAAA